MPYNNQPISPSQEVTGSVSLPMTRVKKIIHADDDLATCSNNAAFAIAVATEQFLQYLVEQTQNVVKAERKPRRNIQYRDVANAVARHDNLEFLTDVVPKTVTFKAHKEQLSKDRTRTVEDSSVAQTSGVNGIHQTPLKVNEEGALPLRPEDDQSKPDHAGPEVMDIDVVVGTNMPPVNGIGQG
ncbi:hypothetical protein ANO11243_081980 [Dothideomycetidae sp. 11243]|nr:hypothetical protein ANO11243_081980 [fungal sp. No.11243]